jgi:hypothetical protein
MVVRDCGTNGVVKREAGGCGEAAQDKGKKEGDWPACLKTRFCGKNGKDGFFAVFPGRKKRDG